MMQIHQYVMVNDDGTDQETYLILAEGRSQADIYWRHFATRDIAHTGWSGKEWERFIKTGIATEISDLMDSKKEGLCVYSQHGWRIVGIEEVI